MAARNVIKIVRTEEADLLRLHKRVLDQSPDLVAIIDADFRFRYVNPSYAAMQGRTVRSFIGTAVRDFVGEDVFGSVVQPNALRCLAGEQVRYSAWFEFAGSGKRFMEVRYLPLLDGEEGRHHIVIITSDITDRNRVEQTLIKSTGFLYNVINTLDEPVTVKDHLFRRIIVNEAFCTLVGRTRDEVVGRTDNELFTEEQALAFRLLDEQACAGAECAEGELTVTCNGAVRTLAVKTSRFIDSPTNSIYLVSVLRDITHAKHTEEQLAHLATHDPLTGLPNRLIFRAHLDHTLSTAERLGQRLAVAMMDLDQFKEINDTLGHQAGDRVLTTIADRLRDLVRKSDIVARMGGDEFMLVLPDQKGDRDIEELAERILIAVRTPIDLNGVARRVGCSIGLAVYPDDGSDADSLIRFADAAMYAVKREGRDGFRRYDSSSNAIEG